MFADARANKTRIKLADSLRRERVGTFITRPAKGALPSCNIFFSLLLLHFPLSSFPFFLTIRRIKSGLAVMIAISKVISSFQILRGLEIMINARKI